MIAKKLMNNIAAYYLIDSTRLGIAISQCEAKGILTVQEYRQIVALRLPIDKVLTSILDVTPDVLLTIIELKQITYNDLMCVIGIIAQDAEVQRQKR